MKNLIRAFFNNEILSYLFFGVLATLVAVGTRLVTFALIKDAMLSTALGNIAAIIFAFFTNDSIVFKQKKEGMLARFVKFATARLGTFLLDLALTFIFVEQFPQIIGQFVNHDLKMINTLETLFAQVTIIVLNYVFSKIFVFKNHQ